MYKIKVNNKFDFEVGYSKDQTFINGEALSPDIHQVNSKSFHILYKNRSFNAELIEVNRVEKTCSIRVNNNIYSASVTDQFDELLHQLGMDNMNAVKVSELKAPMPGMVLKVLVAEGDEVVKGASLLVLEAMKMENIIKSPADVVIRSVKVSPSDKVEKNQVMIVFA